MRFHSFEQLNKLHGPPAGNDIARLLLSILAAAVFLSGLVMLIPLGV